MSVSLCLSLSRNPFGQITVDRGGCKTQLERRRLFDTCGSVAQSPFAWSVDLDRQADKSDQQPVPFSVTSCSSVRAPTCAIDAELDLSGATMNYSNTLLSQLANCRSLSNCFVCASAANLIAIHINHGFCNDHN
jgi:hypothetical protein